MSYKIDTPDGEVWILYFGNFDMVREVIKQQRNMEKRYKLLKTIEAPGIGLPPGQIYSIEEWTKRCPWLLGYRLKELTDWFELVEEKEFTRSDMVAFAGSVVQQDSFVNNLTTKTSRELFLNKWLNNRK
jgi:hypothetical protein